MKHGFYIGEEFREKHLSEHDYDITDLFFFTSKKS